MFETTQLHTDHLSVINVAPQLGRSEELGKQTTIDWKTAEEAGESKTIINTFQAATVVYGPTTLELPQKSQWKST